jgi:hypothetical protein
MAEAPLLTVFVIDCLVRCLPVTAPPEKPVQEIVLRCARNEYECAQIGIRVTKEVTLKAAVSPLRNEAGDQLPATRQRWNFVGTIPIEKNTQVLEKDRLVCRAPCRVPDPLLSERTRKARPGMTEVLWVTFYVPPNASPGVYTGAVTISGGDQSSRVPVTLRVWDFAVPQTRHLQVTNWVNFNAIASSHKVKLWSEEFWVVWRRYLDNLREHRQTMVWVPWRLVDVYEEEDGRLTFDYGRFDRFVQELEAHKVADRLEIQHAGHPTKGWGSPIGLSPVRVTVRTTGARKSVPVTILLKDLAAHLKEKGWLARSMIHIADEPCATNVASWRAAARAVGEAAPGLRRIDAIEATGFGEDLEVWVPKLSHFVHWQESFQQEQARGAEMWFYICCHPYGGRLPNRFHDLPLAMVRLLHWINAAYDLDGYLHWGLTFWNPDDPLGAPRANLPPGDTHVIYPGKDGPLNSVRWEVQRDSLEDFEYLWLLEDRLAAARRRLGAPAAAYSPTRRRRVRARMLVGDCADPVLDSGEIRRVRAEVAEEIVSALTDPIALVWTYPAEGSELIWGPAVVEVHGIAPPGSSVTGLSRLVVNEDGTFRGSAALSPRTSEIRIKVEHGGKVKEIVRKFRFQAPDRS